MRTPPFLLGAGLLFWGWQSGMLLAGIVMALILESSRWVHTRWNLSEEDFSRIWVFCTLLLLGSAIYAFTANDGPADFRGLFQNPNYFTQRNAGTASARTAAALIRWLPMIFFFFIAAQSFSTSEGIPLEIISLILRWRWRKARRLGRQIPRHSVNISYPYFALCLFAASAHSREDTLFFWGLCVLLGWALWATRSRRFSLAVWFVILTVSIGLGYGGQRGIGHLQKYLEAFNAQWLVGLGRRGSDPTRSKTSLGQIGRIKTSGKIVIRLEPKGKSAPPRYLREASYRNYKAQTWYSGNARSEFETVQESLTNKGSWLLLPGKTNSSCIRVACYLEGHRQNSRAGLVPLASGTGFIDNANIFTLYKSKAGTGAILAEGPGLLMFDDYFDEGPTFDSPPESDDDIRAIPPRELRALDQAIIQLPAHGEGTEQTLKSVVDFFQNHFSYSTWIDPGPQAITNETPLARFLLHTRRGHCEYFATATVLMLRRLGIPARYAVGFAVHEASGKNFVVRQRDAHAWCLVWNKEENRWQDFDTTPASWVAAENLNVSPVQFLSDCWSRLVFEFSRLRYGHSRLRQYLLWSLVPILSVLLFQIIHRSRKQRLDKSRNADLTRAPWPGLDSEFYALEEKLSHALGRRQPSQPVTLWLENVLADPALKSLHEPVHTLLRLHYRYRFDPLGLAPHERELLRGQTKACLVRLGARIRSAGLRQAKTP